MAAHAAGLVCLTGGNAGPLAAALARGGRDEGRRWLERLMRMFGHRNVYVELQRHFDRDEEACNQAAADLARTLHLPLVATNGVRYATRQERKILDVFTSIRNHRTLDGAGRLLAKNSERHLKAEKEMS